MGTEVVLFKTSQRVSRELPQDRNLPRQQSPSKNTAEAVSSLLFYPGKSIAIIFLSGLKFLKRNCIMSLSKGQQTESLLFYICTRRRDRLQPFVLKGFLSYVWSVLVCFWVWGWWWLFVVVLTDSSCVPLSCFRLLSSGFAGVRHYTQPLVRGLTIRVRVCVPVGMFA